MKHLALVLLIALAGCGQPAAQDAQFDGDAALAFAAGLITDDGEPRYRSPGTPGHASAADWLEATMSMPEWDVSRQTFTGADFQALDQGSVAFYNQAGSCPADDEQAVPDLTFHNLVATHGPKAKMVWFGAHWDSKEDASSDRENPGAPMLGANDGASGVGVLLQLMQHVSDGDIDVPFGLGIVFFDGEDGFEDCHALAGSIYFARTMEQGLVDRFLLLDMVGDPDARFIRESRSVESDPGFVDLLWKHGTKYAPDAFTDIERAITDDHVPFLEEGVPAVDLIDAGRSTTFPPYWHTQEDTLDKLDAGMLGIVGQTIWDTLEDPAFRR